MFVLKTQDGRYVSGLSRGLLFVTEKIEGSPRFDGNGMTNTALTFKTKTEAERWSVKYCHTKLPRGKVHTSLKPVAVKTLNAITK